MCVYLCVNYNLKQKMKKIILILLLIFTFQKGFTQTSVFEIMFNNKSEKITEKNVEDVYSFIIQIDQMVKSENNVENKYTEDFKSLLTNTRVSELDNILNQIKQNLEVETSENKLNLITKFNASNTSPINLKNYLIEIEKSNFEIEKTPIINSLGEFDYSSNKSMKHITNELKYEFTSKEKIKEIIELDINIKAFKKCNYKIVTNKDISTELLGIKIINISKNHIAIENSNNDFEFFPYKNEKIAKVKNMMKLSIYKPIYEYLKLNQKISIENLKNEFPINKLKKLNTKGNYEVIIFNDNSLDEILILKKEYKELKAKLEKNYS